LSEFSHVLKSQLQKQKHMGKIKTLKGRWVQNMDGDLINLNSFSAIRKAKSGTDFLIQGILYKEESGWIKIGQYKSGEKKIWEEDFKIILKAINS
jgi:hypothetical protein